MTDSEKALTRRALQAELVVNKQALEIASLRTIIHRAEAQRIDGELRALDAPPDSGREETR